MPDPEGTITSADAIVELVVRKYHGEKDIGDLVKTPEKYFAFGVLELLVSFVLASICFKALSTR